MKSNFVLMSPLYVVVLIAGVSPAQTVKGTGTPGTIPFWIDSSTISDSKLTQDQTGNVTAAFLLSSKRGMIAPVVTTTELNLPDSTSSYNGVVHFGLRPFIHDFTSDASLSGSNTFVGSYAGNFNLSGGYNTAIGQFAMFRISLGSENTAIGTKALLSNQTARFNTAIGFQALSQSTGYGNIALGANAGLHLTGGNENIYIGNLGPSSLTTEDASIRIGEEGAQTATYIAGIKDSPLVGSVVTINSYGRLGVFASSARFKREIQDMGQASAGLMRLRAVTFRYKPEYDGGPELHYGLIAEEVAKVYPSLVQNDQAGRPFTVLYHELPAMLLNEVQRQQVIIEKLQSRIEQQEEELESERAFNREQLTNVSTRLASLEHQRAAAIQLARAPKQRCVANESSN
jgi:hypothetical protein